MLLNRNPAKAGGIDAGVDGKGVKRTAHAIRWKVKEISAVGANELYGVKSCVM